VPFLEMAHLALATSAEFGLAAKTLAIRYALA